MCGCRGCRVKNRVLSHGCRGCRVKNRVGAKWVHNGREPADISGPRLWEEYPPTHTQKLPGCRPCSHDKLGGMSREDARRGMGRRLARWGCAARLELHGCTPCASCANQNSILFETAFCEIKAPMSVCHGRHTTAMTPEPCHGHLSPEPNARWAARTHPP